MNFQFVGLPGGNDNVQVMYDELSLFNVPFYKFKTKRPGVYKFKNRGVFAILNFNKQTLKVKKFGIPIKLIKIGKSANVVVRFGESMAVDQIYLDDEYHSQHQRHQHKDHYNQCNNKRLKFIKHQWKR